jgi:hypothetical protein
MFNHLMGKLYPAMADLDANIALLLARLLRIGRPTVESGELS